MFKDCVLPLRILQAVCALFLTVGGFLGFPNDALFSSIFWGITFISLVPGVIQRVRAR